MGDKFKFRLSEDIINKHGAEYDKEYLAIEGNGVIIVTDEKQEMCEEYSLLQVLQQIRAGHWIVTERINR